MKISIITATYNSSTTIRDTIESVLSQTHQDWELIIEDGLSRDNTLDIVREYEPQCKGRMHIFSEKDNGLYDALNRGISRANGEIIGVLHSNDFYYDNNVLEDINRAMSNPDIDCIYGNLIFVKQEDTNRIVRIWKGSQFKQGYFLKGWHPAHPTFYARKKYYELFGGFDTKIEISSDFELMLRFLEVHSLNSLYIPRHFVRMRMGGKSNCSLKNIIKGNLETIYALKKNGMHPTHLYLFQRLWPKVKSQFKIIIN